MTSAPSGDTVERRFREASGRAEATLVRVFGDIDIAEEAVQDPFAVAPPNSRGAGMRLSSGGR